MVWQPGEIDDTMDKVAYLTAVICERMFGPRTLFDLCNQFNHGRTDCKSFRISSFSLTGEKLEVGNVDKEGGILCWLGEWGRSLGYYGWCSCYTIGVPQVYYRHGHRYHST